MSDATRLTARAARNIGTKVGTRYRTINDRKVRLANTFWEDNGEGGENWHWRIIDDSGKASFNESPFIFQSDAIEGLIAALDPMTASANRRIAIHRLLAMFILFSALWLASNLAIRIVAVMFFVRSNADLSSMVVAILAAVGAVSGFPAVLRWLSEDAPLSTFDRRWK